MIDLISSYRNHAEELRAKARDEPGKPIARTLPKLAQLFDEMADALERDQKSAPFPFKVFVS